jgi:glutathione S-transferase
MSQVQLFGSPLSPFVKKVQGALALKKLDYDLVEPSGLRDFKRWSPVTGKMPVLRCDGQAVYDSSFICAWLDERHPEPPLWSRDPAVRSAQRLREDWSDESFYWAIMALRWCDEHAGATAAQITAGMPALLRALAGPMLRRRLTGQARAQGMGRLPVDAVVREIAARLDDLVVQLGDRPFFFSDEPSVADLAVCGQLEGGMSGPTPEVNELVGSRPALGDYLGRVSPGARRALSR